MPLAPECPHCGLTNPPGAAVCTVCSTPLPLSSEPTDETEPGATSFVRSPVESSKFGDETLPRTSGWSQPASPSSTGAPSGTLQPQRVLGNRYEILQLLGEGGMGAVYKARDREVDRFVALKIIRPELASRPDILARFKRELILARQVTHKNVIRIFDLGEADGMKFITMDFVEGRDLKTILREKGKFPPSEAVPIITQICGALDAAHSEGVIHRDLKPQNIMVDAKSRVTVMDFGIARSLEMTAMTQTGSLVGTPEYMSPEQASGEEVDARSDLFTVGIIFFELLTGKTPFHADTAYETLLKRMQERARPPMELDPTIPPRINGVVMKCLETNREQRYASALEIVRDLGQQTLARSRTALAPATVPAAPATVASRLQRYKIWFAAAAGVITLVTVGAAFRGKIMPADRAKNQTVGPSVSLLILPFRNASGDPLVAWMGQGLAEMLSSDVGQSESVRTVPPDRLEQILQNLSTSAGMDFDPSTIRRIADFANADHAVWGEYVKLGDQIRLDATLESLKTQKTTSLKAEGPSQKAVLDELAKAIQGNLALPSGTIAQMKASAFTPSSQSMDALRDYSEGLELVRQRNPAEAAKHFEAAIRSDSNFALAYSWLGRTYAQLGNAPQAEQAARTSLRLSGNLSSVEKYLIQAADGRMENSYARALDAYTRLTQLMPNDPQIRREFGELYKAHGAYDKAEEQYQKALVIDPRDWETLRGLGELEIDLGNPQGAIDHLNRSYSGAVELNNKQGEAIVLQDIGKADNLLNRPDDAFRNFQSALDIRQKIGDKVGTADTLDQIARTDGMAGKPAEAEQKFQEELKIRNEIGDKPGSGAAILNLSQLRYFEGRYEEALRNAQQALQIEIEVRDEGSQAVCLMNLGQISFQLSRFSEALTYQQRALGLFQRLNKPLETARMANHIGATFVQMGQHDQAASNYAQALEQARRLGDKLTISGVLDGISSLDLVQGRYGEALKSQQDAVAYAEQLPAASGTWTAEIKVDYANVLNQVGRGEEARKTLEESLKAALSAKNEDFAAKTLNFLGEGAYYRGELQEARQFFERAQQSSMKAKDRIQSLRARLNLAQTLLSEGRAAATMGTLKALAEEADTLGAKDIATQCSVTLGEALLVSKDYTHSRRELESALRKIQDLGTKSLEPRARYLLSQVMRASGNTADADKQRKLAADLLEQMRQESHEDTLLARFDLKPIVEEAKK